ncbi:MAG: AAA family ATPase, partial [Muribaculaceae bacterium]|nr:AAA family ATPase [Muribaculaceae bacterium]
QAYHSNRSEFIAIYGRRRVGKTFLVRQLFADKFAFTYSGMPNVSTKVQLHNFYRELQAQGCKAQSAPKNWTDAFFMLRELVASKSEGKKVIFLDELPWMDGRQSSFLPAFENFWNAWASARNDILLIICGSATSWIVKKILHNRGGLHNRLTNQICLEPFNLKECEDYAKEMDLPLDRQQVIEGYMVFGGIPFYWSLLERNKSLTQNIDSLFFGRKAKLKDEFQQLYRSLFAKPEVYVEIIKALGTKKVGMTRDEIISSAKLDSGGKLTGYLEDLENCGFIRRYQAIGSKKKNALYQLVDNFTLFYFRFMDGKNITDANYWSKIQTAPIYHNWCGLAFERVCLLHSEQIKKALGISGVITNEYSWRTAATDEHPGAQIDLLIDRSDKAINLCEIKYSDVPYTINKKYMENLRNKTALFRQLTKTRKGIALTMITSSSLVKNSYSMNSIHSHITSDDLFADA